MVSFLYFVKSVHFDNLINLHCLLEKRNQDTIETYNIPVEMVVCSFCCLAVSVSLYLYMLRCCLGAFRCLKVNKPNNIRNPVR